MPLKVIYNATCLDVVEVATQIVCVYYDDNDDDDGIKCDINYFGFIHTCNFFFYLF